MDHNLNVRAKTTKFLGKKKQRKLSWHRFGNNSVDITTKAQATEEGS